MSVFLLLAATPAGPLRLATQSISLVVDGRAEVFPPGLDVDPADADEALTEGADLSRRAVRWALAAAELQPWQAVGLVGAGRIYRVPAGATRLDEARLIIEGRIEEVSIDDGGVAAALVEEPSDDRGLLLEPAAVVGPRTWPRTDAARTAAGEPAVIGTGAASSPAVEGTAYPVLIGRPGQGVPLRALGMLLTDAVPAGPALLVETSDATTALSDHTILISSGRIEAATVRRISTDQNGAPCAEVAAVEVITDLLGRQVSVCRPQSALTVPLEEAEGWICLPSGGGIADPYGRGLLRRADHVLRWALARSTLRLDQSQMPRLSALSRYLVDTAVYSQATPWAWLQPLLAQLPVEVAVGPRGLYLWPTADGWSPRPADALRRLVVGAGCSRVSAVVRDGLSPVTSAVVRFAYDARRGRCLRSVEVGVGTAAPDLWAARAAAVYGVTRAEIECTWTADEATATRVGLDLVTAACRPRYVVEVQVPAEDADGLRPGDLVEVIDEALRLAPIAQIRRVSFAGGAAVLSLRWSQQLGSAD